MSTLGRCARLTPQDYCQPQCPEGIKKGDGDGGGHAEQCQIARQSLAAPGQYVCSEEPDDYPDQREGAADYRVMPVPNLSSSLAKAKLMTTPSNIARIPATVMTALSLER